MINLASRLLKEFVGRYEDVYGLSHMTCNLHHLLHIPDIVRELRPLWVTLCYPFEGLTGLLKKLIHRMRFVQLQISSAVTLFINITREKFITFLPGSKIVSFCKRLELSGKNRLELTKIFENTSIIGKLKELKVYLMNRYLFFSIPYSERNPQNFLVSKLFKNHVVYESDSHIR